MDFTLSAFLSLDGISMFTHRAINNTYIIIITMAKSSSSRHMFKGGFDERHDML